MDEDRVESMRQAVHTRANEKNLSLFEAATELANEAWDYDEQEIYRLWRVELLPRKQPRNPLKRLTRYLAERHPYLGWIGCTALGLTLGATFARPGYEWVFYPLAGFLLLWLISHREIVAELFYAFRPHEAWLDRHMAGLRKAMVDDLVTLGHPLDEAESTVDLHIAELRSAALHRRQK
jgi:hypothetical protein